MPGRFSSRQPNKARRPGDPATDEEQNGLPDAADGPPEDGGDYPPVQDAGDDDSADSSGGEAEGEDDDADGQNDEADADDEESPEDAEDEGDDAEDGDDGDEEPDDADALTTSRGDGEDPGSQGGDPRVKQAIAAELAAKQAQQQPGRFGGKVQKAMDTSSEDPDVLAVVDAADFTSELTKAVVNGVAANVRKALAPMVKALVAEGIVEAVARPGFAQSIVKAVSAEFAPRFKATDLLIAEVGDTICDAQDAQDGRILEIQKAMTPIVKSLGGVVPAPTGLPAAGGEGIAVPAKAEANGKAPLAPGGEVIEKAAVTNPHADADDTGSIDQADFNATIAKAEKVQERTGRPIEGMSNIHIVAAKGGLTRRHFEAFKKAVDLEAEKLPAEPAK